MAFFSILYNSDINFSLLCNKYCVIEEVGQKNEVIMQVSGITSFSDFKAAEDYLNNLSSIKRVEVIKIETHNVKFRLTLLGHIDSMIEGINLSRTLQVDEQPKSIGLSDDSEFLVASMIEQEILSLENREQQNDDQKNSERSSQDLRDSLPPLNSSDKSMIDNKPNVEILYYRWFG